VIDIRCADFFLHSWFMHRVYQNYRSSDIKTTDYFIVCNQAQYFSRKSFTLVG
jgi:hypothetical protein